MDPYIVDSQLMPMLLQSCNLEKPFDIQEGVKNLLEYMWACLEVGHAFWRIELLPDLTMPKVGLICPVRFLAERAYVVSKFTGNKWLKSFPESSQEKIGLNLKIWLILTPPKKRWIKLDCNWKPRGWRG